VGMFYRSCDVQGKGWSYLHRGGGGVYLGECLFIVIMRRFLLFGRICGYVYQQRCRSFVILVYLNCICGISSSVFSNLPFFSMCNTSSVWSIVLYLCPVSSIC
jgi:hypothetical protein